MGSSTADGKWIYVKNILQRVLKDRDLGQAHLFPSPLIGPFSGPIPRGPARLSIRAVPWFPSCPTGAPPLPLPRMLQPMLQSLWGLKRRILLWRRRWNYSRWRKESSDLSRGDQATKVALRPGNLVGPWRLALPPPTPGWGSRLARGAGCSGLGCQHSPLNSTPSRHRTLLSGPLKMSPAPSGPTCKASRLAKLAMAKPSIKSSSSSSSSSGSSSASPSSAPPSSSSSSSSPRLPEPAGRFRARGRGGRGLGRGRRRLGPPGRSPDEADDQGLAGGGGDDDDEEPRGAANRARGASPPGPRRRRCSRSRSRREQRRRRRSPSAAQPGPGAAAAAVSMATALSAASGGGGPRNGLSAGPGSQARRWRLHRDERATASPLKQDLLAPSLPQGQGPGSRRRPRGDKPESPPCGAGGAETAKTGRSSL